MYSMPLPAVLVTRPNATQNSPFLPQRWLKQSPVLVAPTTTEGWPGWVGQSGLDK